MKVCVGGKDTKSEKDEAGWNNVEKEELWGKSSLHKDTGCHHRALIL